MRYIIIPACVAPYAALKRSKNALCPKLTTRDVLNVTLPFRQRENVKTIYIKTCSHPQKDRFNVILLGWKQILVLVFLFFKQRSAHTYTAHAFTRVHTRSHTVNITSWNDELTVHDQKPKAERDIWLDSPCWGNFPTWSNNKVLLCSIVCCIV